MKRCDSLARPSFAPDSKNGCAASVGQQPLLQLAAMLATLAFATPATAQNTDAGGARDEVTLPTVNVKDTHDREAQSYQGGTTSVGKVKQLPKDVPQALTIVSEKLIFDKGNDTLKDALRNVSGLTFNAGEGGRIGDNMNLRGFYTFGDLYLDGVRDVAQVNREVFNLEQIDVLRGSAAMLFGRGQAGGVINQVSKQPGLVDRGSVAGTLGTYDYKRVTADVNKVVGENAALRINAMKTDAGSSRDEVTTERAGIAPAIRFGIGTADEFSLSYYYLDIHNVPDYGVPFFDKRPVDVPANRYYGTVADYEDNVVSMTTATYIHRFSPQTEFKTVLRMADYERDLWVSAPRLAAGATAASVANGTAVVTRNRSARGAEEHTLTSQSDFVTRFTTGSLKHEALVGLELLDERAGRWNYTTSAGSAPTTTVGNPNPTPPLPAGYGGQQRSGINTYDGFTVGWYAQDAIEFLPGWKILLGLRRDDLNASYSNGAQVDYGEWSYRTGLSWQPSDFHHYYATYSDSFSPTADLYQFTSTTIVFPAERSKTYELGAKWELYNGDLSLRTAVYRTEKTYERNTDVESAQNATLLSRKRHTDGVELEWAGRITRRWEVFGGVALMRALIDEAATNLNSVGMRPRNAPPYTFNVWTTYKLDGPWRVGLGVEGKGARLAYGLGGTAPINANVAPRYARWDAMLAYEQPRYTVKLNLQNLLDKRYYESVYENGGHVVPGTERAIQVTGEFRF